MSNRLTWVPMNSKQPPFDNRPLKGTAEIITPLNVHGKSKVHAGTDSRLRRRTNLLILGLILALILISGGWLLQYLARDPVIAIKPAEENSKPEAKPPANAQIKVDESSPATIDPAELAAQKEQAEQKLADFIKIKSLLDSKGASEWGSDLFVEMTTHNQAADALFLEKDYLAAAQKYVDATAVAGQLSDQQGIVFKQLMADGQTALEDGDGKLAQQKFSVALMIDPAHTAARQNLARAGNIEAVMDLMTSGKAHEQNGNLVAARADYQAALKLDPVHHVARESLQRVESHIANQEFKRLMSKGLAAYHKKDYARARSSLLSAKSIKPQSREVLDAIADVDNAIRLERIETLRVGASAAEQSEEWQQALKAYLAVLEIDGNVRFAIEGKARSMQQIRIRKRINFYLDKPTTLDSDRQLENAILLVREVEELDSRGPRLGAGLQKLKQLIQAAQTPIKVTLESDALTDVVIYKVAKLGRFSARELDLRPGTYTIVGSRDGYQDVRTKLVIKPGQKSQHVSIVCRVKI